MTEAEKRDRPFAAEKTDIVEYSIKLTNNSEGIDKSLPSGYKHRTKIQPKSITDVFGTGLKYNSVSAKAYKADGSEKSGNITVTATDKGNNTYLFTLPNGTTLEPGEYVIFKVNQKCD